MSFWIIAPLRMGNGILLMGSKLQTLPSRILSLHFQSGNNSVHISKEIRLRTIEIFGSVGTIVNHYLRPTLNILIMWYIIIKQHSLSLIRAVPFNMISLIIILSLDRVRLPLAIIIIRSTGVKVCMHTGTMRTLTKMEF